MPTLMTSMTAIAPSSDIGPGKDGLGLTPLWSSGPEACKSGLGGATPVRSAPGRALLGTRYGAVRRAALGCDELRALGGAFGPRIAEL